MIVTEGNDPLVVTTFGRRVEVRLADGRRVMARIKGRQLRPVCGDRVAAESIEGEKDYLVTDVLARKNVLSRPDSRGRVEVLAANVTMIVAVASPVPKPDWFIIDRYLSAAELAGAIPVVVWNKADLDPDNSCASELERYREIGFRVQRTSANTGEGIEELAELLSTETGIFVGLSGVGKSSLINRLLGSSNQKTATVSEKSGEGRHTTVNSALKGLPGGGAVIDSPGVRDYAPAIESPERTVVGFREIEAAGSHCKFGNCRHLREPHCAVKAAVDDGSISPRRYESYRRLLRLTEGFSSNR